ncbi:dTDP-glucose 4,6-dehydratase (fragment) [Sphingomonas aurantiaca]|uniref:dTDP-glucose 4,6-dehydratase n=1 Tax=Sphingomonas aurantiaca TaxID=185949 RepID=A0A5E7XNG0_9SPHN
MNILITRGAGFIGFTVFHPLLEKTDHLIANVNQLPYAADLESARIGHSRYGFGQANIGKTSAACKSTENFGKTGYGQYLLRLANKRR